MPQGLVGLRGMAGPNFSPSCQSHQRLDCSRQASFFRWFIAEAKNTLPKLIDRALQGEEVIITRHGKPVAEVIPAAQTVDRAAWIGSLKGKIKILGDIVSPVIDLDEIEALRD